MQIVVKRNNNCEKRGGGFFSFPQFRRYAEKNIKKERICALGYEFSHIQFLPIMRQFNLSLCATAIYCKVR